MSRREHINQRTELFVIHARGVVAQAFLHSGRNPSVKSWKIIRGEKAATVRDIGEISYETGVELFVTIHDRKDGDDD